MIIKSNYIIDGFKADNPLDSDTTALLYFDTKNMVSYIDIFNDITKECISRIYVNDILNALSVIIR